MTTLNPQIDTYSIYEPKVADGWLMSDWAAGQTSIMNWEDQNVRTTSSGDVELVLAAAPFGSSRPYNGAEIQSAEVATTGTWSWTAQAPDMVDGAVFGMFTYREDWQNQPWVEFDFEFVGSDTTKVQLNIHMEDANGNHISLDQTQGGSIIVDLGFDASQGMHTYDVTVSDTSATFRVDGQVVGVYGAADMPGGVWQIGPQKSYVDLWCTSGLDHWSGAWSYDGVPLVATVQGADVRPGDLSGAVVIVLAPVVEGDEGANILVGTTGNDTVNGHGGNDVLSGDAGNDALNGGDGNDVLRLDAGNDVLDGGNGTDWAEVTDVIGARINLALTVAQTTGYGSDTIRNVENVAGGVGNDTLTGNDGVNQLRGNGGNDVLSGAGAGDTLAGGTGNDTLTDGAGNDWLYGEDGDDRLLMGSDRDMMDGGNGLDWVIVSGSAAATVSLSQTGTQTTGYGSDTIRNVENIKGNAGADRLTGSSGANVIQGEGGSDTLWGGAGTDTLAGGSGRDLLYGGADSQRDVFVFNATAESGPGTARDVIYNFVPGVDDVDLRLIDARTDVSGDQAFAFTGSTASAFGVWAVASGSDTLVRADVNGDKVADFEVLLSGVKSVAAGDFLL